MTAAVLLVALVLLAGTAHRTGLTGAVALAGCSVVWLLANGPMEGPTLLSLGGAHGLTGGDLAGFAGLALALRTLWERRGRRWPGR